MKNIGYIFLLSIILLSSCVRDEIEPCPPLKVMIGVKDKNYFNIDKIERVTGLEQRVDENLPFRAYVQKLFYAMYNAETGEEIFVRHLHDVQGEAPLATGYIPEDLPFGKYVLVVWGNIFSEKPILEDKNHMVYKLHMNQIEGFDTYMTCDTLLYDATHSDYTVDLERVKGKLIIQLENLPDNANYSDKSLSGLYHYLDYQFNYFDQTEVEAVEEWKDDEETVCKHVLSPSVKEKGTNVKMRFYDNPDLTATTLLPKDVNITMNRNEITVLRYVYDDGKRDFNIYVLVNDNWEQEHGMVVN